MEQINTVSIARMAILWILIEFVRNVIIVNVQPAQILTLVYYLVIVIVKHVCQIKLVTHVIMDIF